MLLQKSRDVLNKLYISNLLSEDELAVEQKDYLNALLAIDITERILYFLSVSILLLLGATIYLTTQNI